MPKSNAQLKKYWREQKREQRAKEKEAQKHE
jgi:hypothetical protein